MRMEGAEYPEGFVSELALDPGSIGEYLVNEVLRQQPEAQRRLLIETSFLDEVTGALADAVTGLAGCGDMLADVARENSFVIPLDSAQTRFRYHELFAEILRYLLQRHKRQAIRILKERGGVVRRLRRPGERGLLGRAGGGPAAGGQAPGAGGFAHAFVHRQDLSGLGLRDLLPLRLPDGADSAVAAQFAVAHAVIDTVFADAGSAASVLTRLPAVKSEPDADLLVTSDLVELILGQKACDLRAVDTAANRLLGRSGDAPAPVMPGLRAAVLRSSIAGDLGGRARVLQRILLPDAVGADPSLAAALVLGQASILRAGGRGPDHAARGGPPYPSGAGRSA
jgi:LuxR family transcriptional regulator, maltose regulon positive regulatory protein